MTTNYINVSHTIRLESSRYTVRRDDGAPSLTTPVEYRHTVRADGSLLWEFVFSSKDLISSVCDCENGLLNELMSPERMKASPFYPLTSRIKTLLTKSFRKNGIDEKRITEVTVNECGD